LDDVEFLYLDQPDGLRRSDHAKLRDALARVSEACDRLVDGGIPQTLHHGDLHDGNVFVRLDGNSTRYVIFDWGDSCVSHPFFTLRTTAACLQRTLGLSSDSGEWSQVRDAYLEPWTRFTPRAGVEQAAELAEKLAPIEGALRWYHTLRCVPPELRQDWREPIPRLLENVLASLG
jgi:Ser/Thr protein kinase RdoA (MazF antagonist)